MISIIKVLLSETNNGRVNNENNNRHEARPFILGSYALPQNTQLKGTVTRDNGETGALLLMPTGRMAQGNAGTLRGVKPD